VTVTRYRILARPELGPFLSASEAVLVAAILNLPMDWEAVWAR
jgi:hypothetical protein